MNMRIISALLIFSWSCEALSLRMEANPIRKLETSIAEKSQLDQDLIGHKQDREAANQDLAKATAIREKEHAEYLELTGESKENLDAMTSAIAALEKGMGGGFLQSKTSLMYRLHKILNSAQSLDAYQRSTVTAFLS